MSIKFGVFDHIEPVEKMPLHEVYNLRMQQIEQFDNNGFYAYHLAEHHTPAVHSLAPSQNVFLAAASQKVPLHLLSNPPNLFIIASFGSANASVRYCSLMS